MFIYENKQGIADALCACLKKTREFEHLDYMNYHCVTTEEEGIIDEFIDAVFDDGTMRRAFVYLDKGVDLILQVIEQIREENA